MPRITKLGSFLVSALPSALLGLGVLLGVLAGSAWLLWAPTTPAAQADGLTSYKLNDPIFHYSPGWQVSELGADPREPADPWRKPAGVITFTVVAAEIDLLLAVGDYWGYLYVTVDGQPANQLPVLAGNVNSLGQVAGYKTLYAPEQQQASGPGTNWVTVQRNRAAATPQQVRVEVWRSWGQSPLRGVAVRATPAVIWPRWPGVLLLVLAGWGGVGLGRRRLPLRSHSLGAESGQNPKQILRLAQRWLTALAGRGVVLLGALLGLLLVVLGGAGDRWWLALPGLGLLGLAALVHPALWSAALLVGLPFYFRFPLPVLPGRSLGLIDIGVWGGLLIVSLRWLGSVLLPAQRSAPITPFVLSPPPAPASGGRLTWRRSSWIVLAALVSWTLVSTFAADHFVVALREWRTVFLAAGLFALMLHQTDQEQPVALGRPWSLISDHRLLLAGWLAGAGSVALVALWQYGAGQDLITAEGVWRVRAFYGSPNNLALYLERALAVTLALLLFANSGPPRLLWSGLALLQGAALVLTFSKGALLLGLPLILLTLALGSTVLLRHQRRARVLLWWLLGAGLLAGLALLPFLGTERFQRLLDFQQGTGFVRLQLWRSAWQMALDHPGLGVGPDNFLYQYRSNYLLPAAWQEPNLNHPHNWLLDWWTRLGLPGLALALLFFGVVGYSLWGKIQRKIEPGLSLGLLAALSGALAHGLIDASYALPDLMLVWVLIAYLATRQSSQSPQPA